QGSCAGLEAMVVTRARALPCLVRPDRYSNEGVRDWLAATFPVYGIVEPEPTWMQLSGKGRGGRRPTWAPNWYPERLWTRLHSLHASFQGDGRWVKVTSSSRDHGIHEHLHEMIAGRSRNGHDDTVYPTELWQGDLMVDGALVDFRGAQSEAQWSCVALVDGGSIHLRGNGIEPAEIELERMRDPGPALRGQRERERRGRGR
ncbi:MAG: hypothetical protein AAF081_02395, partial [Actinomycetota bacterium]